MLTKRFGDYCSDIYVNIFVIPLIGILIIINLIILYITDTFKSDYSITNKIVLTLLSILIISLTIGYLATNQKPLYRFDTISKLSTYKKNYSLEMFKNNNYQIVVRDNHYQCYYKGKYVIKNNILKLQDLNDAINTDRQVSNKYIINNQLDTLKPLNQGYPYLVLFHDSIKILR
ncbi:hypothetical protein ETU09_09890 [Apibacter muscae]|uniref:Uncharacterized protein n=1 Tax=Apibacter muscae TaxID=2509004 RepID=A0A563D9G6_9FLAO|nr:hypothetical protein [Apibacter muscae]TWP26856.1 hypothetical protein ETU09_09890 [Apibacter muscae]